MIGKVTRVLPTKCAPVSGIAKCIAMDPCKRCLFARHGDDHWSLWSVYPEYFK